MKREFIKPEIQNLDKDYMAEFLYELECVLKGKADISIFDERGGLRCAMDICEDWYKVVKKTTNENVELVDHPDHYNTGGLECIEAMRRLFGDNAVQTFCKLTAFKYYFRRGNKTGEDFDRDTKKAEWYLDYMETKEKERHSHDGVLWF